MESFTRRIEHIGAEELTDPWVQPILGSCDNPQGDLRPSPSIKGHAKGSTPEIEAEKALANKKNNNNKKRKKKRGKGGKGGPAGSSARQEQEEEGSGTDSEDEEEPFLDNDDEQADEVSEAQDE